MKSSDSERFEGAYRLIWRALNKPDDPDLSQHERQVLHHVAAADGTPLSWLAEHLGLPKSTASVLVKALAQRGFVHRVRHPDDERRLSITLTEQGRRRVEEDTVLDPAALSAALARLPAATRAALLDGMERLAEAADPASRSRDHHR
jgi:MarR family transcriptional regulator, organic hydroperoxide resistance regulator